MNRTSAITSSTLDQTFSQDGTVCGKLEAALLDMVNASQNREDAARRLK